MAYNNTSIIANIGQSKFLQVVENRVTAATGLS
jgi:hypothetical protein